MSKTSKILQLLNYRLRITIQDGRVFVGNMLAFDKHMNLVLSECDEYRRIKPKGSAAGGAKSAVEREEKRSLGLVILRGETIVSMSIEAPPPPSDEARAKAGAPMGGSGGPGVARPAGRGLPLAPNAGVPAGLSGPVRGVGGPAAAAMMPQMGAPVAYGRPPVPPPGMFPPQMPPFPGAGRGFPPGGVPPGGPGAPPMPFPPMPGGRGMPPMPPGFRPPVGMPALPPGMPPPRPGMPFPPPPGFRPPQ